MTVFFIGAVVEVLRSEETLNDTTKNYKREFAIVIALLPPVSSYQ